MFTKSLSSVLFCLICLLANAQIDSALQGVIYSGETLKPLSDAVVRVGNYNQKTDINGQFSLKIKSGESLIVSHPKFHTQTISADEFQTRMPFKTYLTPSAYVSSEVRESQEVQAIYKPELEQIFDYTFKGDTLIVASHPELSLNSVKMTPSNDVAALVFMVRGEVVSKVILRASVSVLLPACDGQLYLFGESSVWKLTRRSEKEAFEQIDSETFLQLVAPCFYADSSYTYNLVSLPYLPQVDLLRFEPATKRYTLIRSIRNEPYFSKIDDDYSMLSYGQRREAELLAEKTGIPARSFAPYLRRFYVERNLKLPFTKAFLNKDTMFVFDHANHKLFRHNALGYPIDNLEIYHAELTRETIQNLIKDPYSNVIYAVHDRAGSMVMRRIDTGTGATGRPFKLHHPFPKEIQVFEGYVYYLYKPTEKGTYFGLVREKL